MDWFWLAAYVAVLVGVGALAAAAFEVRERAQLSRTVGLVSTLGAGGVGYALFVLGLLGVRAGRATFAVLAAVALAGVALLCWQRSPFCGLRAAWGDLRPRHRLVSVVLMALLLACTAVVMANAAGFRLHEWDAFAIWALKAKVIAAEGLVPRPGYFSDASLSYSHLDYPLMVPMLMAGVYGVLEHVDDRWAKLPEALLYPGLVCLVFSFCRRRCSAPMSLAITVVACGAPLTLRLAGSGMADVALMAFYTASVICLIEWRESSRWRACVLGGVMAAFCAFTKNEGLALAAIHCAVMLAGALSATQWRRRLLGAGLCIGVFVVLVLPWVLWARAIPRTHGDYLGNLSVSTIAANVARVPTILGAFAHQIISIAQHGPLWLVLVAVATLRWRTLRDPTIRWVWVLLVAHQGVYALVFLVTPHDVVWHMGSSLHRLVLHAVPVGGLLVALHVSPVGTLDQPRADSERAA